MPFNFVGRRVTIILPRRSMYLAALFSVLAAVSPDILRGQTSVFDQFNPVSSSARGVHLYGISVFSGYYSAGVPYGNGIPITVSPEAQASFDVSLGTVATFGWNRSGERYGVTAKYSPSYFGSIRHSEYNMLNHNLSFSWSRKLTGKWSVSVSAAGMTAEMQQLLFTPTTLSTVASVPTTFDDLTSALLAGKFTNPQLASILTGTPLTASPNQTFLYGQRILSATSQASLSYAASGRSSFHFDLIGTRIQQLRNRGTPEGAGNSGGYLMPQTTSAAASFGWSFSFTPRTQIGLTATSTRTFSRLQEGYATATNFSVGHTLSRHWFLQATGGAGTLTYTHRTFQGGGNVQYLAGGSIGFKSYAHTLMASYNRSLGDVYGLGSGSTGSSMGTWNWKRPGSGWSASSGFAYQRLSNQGFRNPISWQVNAGIARVLSPRLFMNVQYTYLKFPSLTSKGLNFSQNGVMLALNWSPSDYR